MVAMDQVGGEIQGEVDKRQKLSVLRRIKSYNLTYNMVTTVDDTELYN